MTRLTPKVFSDPFAGPSASDVAKTEEAWPPALNQLKGATDAWAFGPTDLQGYLGQRSPDVARLVLTNAVSTLDQVSKRVGRRGIEKSSATALRQADKALDQALAPQNLGHASELEASLLQSSLRALLNALRPHASEGSDAGKLAERLGSALRTSSSSEIEEVVLSTKDGQLFDKEPVNECSPLRVLYEGPIGPSQLRALSQTACDRPVQLVDLDEGSFAHLWSGPDSKVRCDNAAWVVEHSETLTLGQIGNPEDLSELISGAASQGLDAVHLQLESSDPQKNFDAALLGLDALSNAPPDLALTVRDEGGAAVLSARPSKNGIRIRLPTIPRSHAAEIVGVITQALENPKIGELSFGGVGFVREGNGRVELKLSGSAELRQVAGTVAPILAHQLADVLELEIGSEARTMLRPFFRDAVEHLNRTADDDVKNFRHPQLWQQSIEGIAKFTSDPQRKEAFVKLLTATVRKSEAPGNDGFGNAGFQGHSRSHNAFDLVRAFHSSSVINDPDTFVEQANRLFEDPVRGATVSLAFDNCSGTNRGRRNSARTEKDRLRVLQDFAGAARAKGSRVMLAILPTDRTHGQARTATPDFYVKREDGGSLSELFVDAKARSIQALEEKDLGVAKAAFQVFNHRFGEGQADGMVMLRVYGGETKDRARIIDQVQAELDQHAPRDKRKLWVQLQIHNQGQRPETLMLTPTHAPDQAPLPAALS